MMEGLEAAVLLLLAVPAAVAIRARWLGCYPAFVPEWEPRAEMRAAALLRDLLSESERAELGSRGFLSVPSPGIAGRVYRVPARPGHVRVYEAGELAMTICVRPTGWLPPDDVVAMHKLMIDGNEGEYLRRARVHWRRATG